MTVPLGNPYALGNTGVPTSARVDRLALGASFRPSAAALGATSGFLYGPAGTMGDLTLLTDVLLRVDPFLAVVQGTHAANQGQYLVPNDTTRDLAVPAKDASLFRRALVVVRVADSLAAGVASSAATDGAWLEVIPGPLAASNPALPSMAPYANYLLVGELSIPSTASGQPVTITKYNPRTTTRGGILPVLSTDTTAGAFVDQYRSHPTIGLQRFTGTRWVRASDVPVFATVAARDAFYAAPNLPVAGTQCLTNGIVQTHDGAAWRFVVVQAMGGVGDGLGLVTVAHGWGQAPSVLGVSAQAGATDQLSIISKAVPWSSDATNVVVRHARTDSSAWLAGNGLNWTASMRF